MQKYGPTLQHNRGLWKFWLCSTIGFNLSSENAQGGREGLRTGLQFILQNTCKAEGLGRRFWLRLYGTTAEQDAAVRVGVLQCLNYCPDERKLEPEGKMLYEKHDLPGTGSLSS